MIVHCLLLAAVACMSTVFSDNFNSDHLQSSKWAIIGSGYLIRDPPSGNSQMLTLNYSTDPRWLASRWISASPGTYYLVEIQTETNTKSLTILPSSTSFINEGNLAKDHFTLSITYAQNAVLSLVNPFRQQSIRIQLNANNVVVTSNISLSTCTMTTTTPTSTDTLTVVYSSAERSVQVAVGSQPSFKCNFSSTTFVYGVLYYTISPRSSTNFNVKKSQYDHCGLSIAIEGADSGCNVGASGSNCLLIYGHNFLSNQQSAAIHPGQSNTSYKISYVFRNTFTQFRILLSDLKQYEDQPQPYDTFLDNLVISSLLNPEEYKLTIDNSLTRYLVSGVSDVSFTNTNSPILGVQLSLVNHRSMENKQDSPNFFYNIATVRLTNYSDIIETDSGVSTVYGYAGDDVIVSASGTQTIWSGTGTDTIVVDCHSSSLILPDHTAGDIVDLTAFGIVSNASTLLTFVQGITNTVVSFTVQNRTVSLSIPNNIPLMLATVPTPVQCNLDIGVGYYPTTDSCIYVCPCNTVGLFCNFTDSTLTSTALVTTSNVFCGSYNFEMTHKNAVLNPTYQLSSTTDIPHYKLTVVVQLFIVGYAGSDVLTVWADLSVIQYSVLMTSRNSKICSSSILGEGMYINQTFQHYSPAVTLQMVLQSTVNSYFYINSAMFVVSKCYSGCQYCNGSSQADCISCSPPFIFSSAGQCYCPSSAVLTSPTVCISCDSLYMNCLSCNTTTCLSCKNNLIINSDLTCINATSCVRDCQICDFVDPTVCLVCQNDFFLLNTSYCQKCESNCLQCTATVCLECDAGYQVNSTSRTQCTFICDPTCLACSGPFINQCTSCPSSRSLVLSAGTCDCRYGRYLDSNSNNCLICSPPCATCTAPNICLTCVNGLSLAGTTCGCSIGQYITSNQSACLSCSSNCSNCLSDTFCLECYYKYTLNSTTNQCDPQKSQSYILTKIDQVTQNLTETTYIISSLSSLPIILRGNPLVVLQLFDITQEISYIQYINVTVPPNFGSYLNLFIKFNLNFFPDLVNDDSLTMRSPPGFADSSMDALFFRNISSNFILLAATVAVYAFFKLLQLLVRKKLPNSCLQFFFDKIVGMFEWAGFITMVLGSYVGLCMSSFLQLLNASVRNSVMFASYVCSFLFLVVLLCIPSLLYYITERGEYLKKAAPEPQEEQPVSEAPQDNAPTAQAGQPSQQTSVLPQPQAPDSLSKKKQRAVGSKQNFDKKFGMIYELYNQDTVYQRNFSIAVLIRKIIYSFNMVYMQEALIAQMVTIILTELALLMAVIFIKPYKSQLFFWKDIVTQALCPVLYVSFILYMLDFLSSDALIIWGYVDVTTVTVIIVMHLFVLIYECYNSVRELWRDYKKFKDPTSRANSHQTQAPMQEGASHQEYFADSVLMHGEGSQQAIINVA